MHVGLGLLCCCWLILELLCCKMRARFSPAMRGQAFFGCVALLLSAGGVRALWGALGKGLLSWGHCSGSSLPALCSDRAENPYSWISPGYGSVLCPIFPLTRAWNAKLSLQFSDVLLHLFSLNFAHFLFSVIFCFSTCCIPPPFFIFLLLPQVIYDSFGILWYLDEFYFS